MCYQLLTRVTQACVISTPGRNNPGHTVCAPSRAIGKQRGAPGLSGSNDGERSKEGSANVIGCEGVEGARMVFIERGGEEKDGGVEIDVRGAAGGKLML